MRSRKQKLFKSYALLTTAAAVVLSAFFGVVVLQVFKRIEDNDFPSVPQFANIELPESQLATTQADEKVVLTVSIVCGGHVECDRGIRPLKLAIKYFESRFNVSFRIEKVLVSDKQPLGTIEERWETWFKTAVELGAAKNDLTVILLENFPDNVDTFDFKMEGIIGLASGIGVLGGPQPAALLAKVLGGEKFMTRLLIHEIGHTLGATHIEEGIMHPCACVNQYSDEFSLASVAQIKEHLAQVALYRIVLSGGSDPKAENNQKVMSTEPQIPVRESIAPQCLK